MHEIHVWNDLQGDFIQHRGTDGKVFLTADYDEAAEIAMDFINDGVQAKVVYVRKHILNPERKKRPRAGRIRRIVRPHDLTVAGDSTEDDIRCGGCGHRLEVRMSDGEIRHAGNVEVAS